MGEVGNGAHTRLQNPRRIGAIAAAVALTLVSLSVVVIALEAR
jgi:hypothetical protein